MRDSQNVRLVPLIGIVLLVVILWSGGTALIWHSIDNPADRGTFGDMFGAVNSLFAGLAFAGILFALHLQRQELIIQREELAAQREELRLTRDELAKTAKAQHRAQQALTAQLDAMRITARLNALSSLIDAYALKIQHETVAKRRAELERDRISYIDQLERVLTELELAARRQGNEQT